MTLQVPIYKLGLKKIKYWHIGNRKERFKTFLRIKNIDIKL